MAMKLEQNVIRINTVEDFSNLFGGASYALLLVLNLNT